MPETELVPETVLTPVLEPPTAGRLTPSPYSFEFTASEALRLTCHNSQAGVVVAMHYRLHTRRGELVANVYRIACDADRLPDSVEFPVGDGYLLNVVVFASSGSPKRGQTFVRVQVIRGRGASATVLGTIVQGYVTGNQDRAWPGSPIEGSLEGDGYYRVMTGTDVAAGTDWFETVPTGARWQLLALQITLVTSATVATRRLWLRIDDAMSLLFASPCPQTVPASFTQPMYWAQGAWLTTAITAGAPIAGIPVDLVMPAGHFIRAETENLQAGDNYGPPRLLVREWLEAQ